MLRIAKAEGEKISLNKFIFNCLANMLDYGPADEDVFKGTYHSLIAPLLPLIKLQNIDFYNKFVIL